MILGAIVALCIVIAILAFLFPRFSRHPQHGSQRVIGAGGQVAGKAPGPLGRWLRKPFDTSNRAVAKSGEAGRKGRAKIES